MNKTLMAAGLAAILGACSSSKKSDVAEGATPNPFFAEYTTPFGVPPFDQIEGNLFDLVIVVTYCFSLVLD